MQEWMAKDCMHACRGKKRSEDAEFMWRWRLWGKIVLGESNIQVEGISGNNAPTRRMEPNEEGVILWNAKRRGHSSAWSLPVVWMKVPGWKSLGLMKNPWCRVTRKNVELGWFLPFNLSLSCREGGIVGKALCKNTSFFLFTINTCKNVFKNWKNTSCFKFLFNFVATFLCVVSHWVNTNYQLIDN